MAVDLAIIVSTYERPGHLVRCLASLDVQHGVAGRFEVVVSDDGSRDETLPLLRSLASQVSYPLSVVTHEHKGFRLARCRNAGAAATAAPYLLFTDGDCVLPAGHLLAHLEARRPRIVIGSDCARLDAEATARVDLRTIRAGRVARLVSLRERLRLAGKAIRAKAYELGRVSMRPRLTGNNIALWRHDFERINGFDEQFVGWGYEDRDLQDRLERAGLRVRSLLWRTVPVHLWHPPAPTFVRNGDGTANKRYFLTADRPVVCSDGLCTRRGSLLEKKLARAGEREAVRLAVVQDV